MKFQELKILHVIPNLRRAGGERICLDICNALIKKGHKVKLVVFENINQYPELSSNIDIEFIPSEFIPSLFKESHLDIQSLQLLVDSFKPDIIHSHLLGAEYITMHLKTPNSTKFFNHIHGNRPELKKISIKNISKNSIINRWEKTVYRKLLKQKSVKHIAISNECYQFYNKIVGVNKKNIIYLPNCIDYNHFKSDPKTINSGKTLSLITIGRLIPSKGHDFLLNVLKIILSKNVNSNLTIIGNGPEKDNLLNKAKELNISEKINFIEITKHPETFLKEADLYLHSSYYEPFGLVILEAMASGLPVVCTDGKGNRGLIEEGINGYMLKERNANEFANKILTLIKSKELYSSQSKNAIEFSSGFDISEYVKKLIDYYRKELN